MQLLSGKSENAREKTIYSSVSEASQAPPDIHTMSDMAAEIFREDRNTVTHAEPPSPAAKPMPSTAAAPSSTSFAPRPEQLICSHLKDPGPELPLDKELRDRILRRVKDRANLRAAAHTLFTQLD